MNTDRRSWILSVLSALPLMRFLKPTAVTKGNNFICARCGNRRECAICEMTCSNCLGKRPSCSMCLPGTVLSDLFGWGLAARNPDAHEITTGNHGWHRDTKHH